MNTGSGIPCVITYDAQNDYVYLSNNLEQLEIFRAIASYEYETRDGQTPFDRSGCEDSTLRMLCRMFLPRCGNSTHFEPPTSVCSDACHQQSQICSDGWRDIGRRFNYRISNNPLNCSKSESFAPFSCSSSGVYMRKFN